jgi:hypothetical protein
VLNLLYTAYLILRVMKRLAARSEAKEMIKQMIELLPPKLPKSRGGPSPPAPLQLQLSPSPPPQIEPGQSVIPSAPAHLRCPIGLLDRTRIASAITAREVIDAVGSRKPAVYVQKYDIIKVENVMYLLTDEVATIRAPYNRLPVVAVTILVHPGVSVPASKATTRKGEVKGYRMDPVR